MRSIRALTNAIVWNVEMPLGPLYKMRIARRYLKRKMFKIKQINRLWASWNLQFALLPQRDRAARAGIQNPTQLPSRTEFLCTHQGRSTKNNSRTQSLARGGAPLPHPIFHFLRGSGPPARTRTGPPQGPVRENFFDFVLSSIVFPVFFAEIWILSSAQNGDEMW